MTWTHEPLSPEDFRPVPDERAGKLQAVEAEVKRLCGRDDDPWSGFKAWVEALAYLGWDVDRDKIHKQPGRACDVYNRISRALEGARTCKRFWKHLQSGA